MTHGAPAAAGAWGVIDTGVDVGAELVCGACNEKIIIGYYRSI